MNDDAQVLRVVLPLVKYFEADFDYEYRALGMLQKGHLQIVADNTFAIAELELSTTSKGHLYPRLKNIHIDFGHSEIDEPNSMFLQFIHRQQYHLFKHLVMSAVNQFGPAIFNAILPEYSRSVLNN